MLTHTSNLGEVNSHVLSLLKLVLVVKVLENSLSAWLAAPVLDGEGGLAVQDNCTTGNQTVFFVNSIV